MAQLVLVCAFLLGADRKETTLIPPPFWHDMGYHRASKFYLDMYLGRDFRFDDPQGLACERMIAEGDTANPMKDHLLSLFGVNSGSGQILYNSGMRKLGVFGRTGSGDGEFSFPHGVAVNREGDVYIADTDNDRVVKLLYTAAGLEFVRNYPGFKRPLGVALDSRGLVYVTDQGDSQVVIMDSSGKVLQRWPGMDAPTGIAVIDAHARRNFYSDDFTVVIDRNGLRLTKFSPSGERLATILARDLGLAMAQFAYCAFDYYGNVYVTDQYNDQIHKFDRELHYLVSYGRTGSADGEFKSPRGIAIGRQFGQVFVAEAEGGQYFWVGLDAYMIGCFPEVMKRDQPGTTIALYATETADLAIDISDARGKVIRSLYPGGNREKAGEMLVVWDGRDNAGSPVGPGDYTVHAFLKPTYGGQRKEIRKELTAKVKRI